jgi:probable HAF family extracellular repeat protein
MQRRLLVSLLFSISANAATITDLGTLGGYSWATGINNSGQIVGYSGLGNGTTHAFLYSNGVMKDLGTLGGTNSYAYGINDHGDVVGVSDILFGLPNTDYEHALEYTSDGLLSDLTPYYGANSSASAINDSGVAVGSFLFGNRFGHAAEFYSGIIVDLTAPVPGAYEGAASGINDAGQIVGYSVRYGSGNGDPYDAFLYSNGSITSPQDYVGRTVAYAINSSGEYVAFAQSGLQAAAVFNGDMTTGRCATTIGSNTYDGNVADAINSSGQIVGSADDNNFAIMFQPGSCIDLNTLLPANSGWQLQAATGINDSGQIVGYGTINGQTHAFLLNTQDEPIAPATPEPDAWVLMLTGIVGVSYGAKRKRRSDSRADDANS